MPSSNPKHQKKKSTTKEMGVSRGTESCSISGCTQEGAHHVSTINLEGYMDKLKWSLNIDKKKTKRATLCKKHYKEYKKLKNKDEKFSNFRDFGSNKKPSRDKSHAFLE